MKTNKKKVKIIPESLFAAAFQKLMKCKTDEIDIYMYKENQSAEVYYEEQSYRVDTWDWLFDDVVSMITDPEYAQHVNIPIWASVTKGVLSSTDFYVNLIDTLEDAEQTTWLNLALNISSFTLDKEKVFWSTLLSIDRIGSLFGNAVVAAAKTYHINKLATEILKQRIKNGEQEYNPFVDGLFEEVNLPQKGKDDLVFYIYSAMP